MSSNEKLSIETIMPSTTSSPESQVSTSSILSLLTCSVCLSVCAPGARQCRNGHLCCAHCARRLRASGAHCPVCRDKQGVFVRNVVADSILAALDPTVSCSNGCGLELSVCALPNHEPSCPCRPVTCPDLACGAEFPANSVREAWDHFLKHHSYLHLHATPSCPLPWPLGTGTQIYQLQWAEGAKEWCLPKSGHCRNIVVQGSSRESSSCNSRSDIFMLSFLALKSKLNLWSWHLGQSDMHLIIKFHGGPRQEVLPIYPLSLRDRPPGVVQPPKGSQVMDEEKVRALSDPNGSGRLFFSIDIVPKDKEEATTKQEN